METNQRLLKRFNTGLIAAALLLGCSAAFAQVKIGTNPTAISPANNLEVEASTTGNKISIDKTTGKLTIADGSQGTSKILTSDANGVATWASTPVQDSPVMFSVYNTANQVSGYLAIDKVNFGAKYFDKNINFDLANDNFTIPANAAGIYEFTTTYATLNNGNYVKGVYVGIYVNNVLSRYISVANSPAGAGVGGSGATLIPLNVGDVVDMRWIPSLGSASESLTFFSYNLNVALISR